MLCNVFHVCVVSEVAPAQSWSLIRGGPPYPCVVKKVSDPKLIPSPDRSWLCKPGWRESRKCTYKAVMNEWMKSEIPDESSKTRLLPHSQRNDAIGIDFDICSWSYGPVSEPLFWLLIHNPHWPCWSKKLKQLSEGELQECDTWNNIYELRHEGVY